MEAAWGAGQARQRQRRRRGNTGTHPPVLIDSYVVLSLSQTLVHIKDRSAARTVTVAPKHQAAQGQPCS